MRLRQVTIRKNRAKEGIHVCMVDRVKPIVSSGASQILVWALVKYVPLL